VFVVRVLLSDGSTEAFVCRVVVVVVLVFGAVVQPTSATTQTPKTNGISFFIVPRSIPMFGLAPPFSPLHSGLAGSPCPSPPAASRVRLLRFFLLG
jgi:hypothetical protein